MKHPKDNERRYQTGRDDDPATAARRPVGYQIGDEIVIGDKKAVVTAVGRAPQERRLINRNVIEKLTAPPETLTEHMSRIGLAWEELNGQIRFNITDMDIAEGRY